MKENELHIWWQNNTLPCPKKAALWELGKGEQQWLGSIMQDIYEMIDQNKDEKMAFHVRETAAANAEEGEHNMGGTDIWYIYAYRKSATSMGRR